MGNNVDKRFRSNPLAWCALLLGLTSLGATAFLAQEWAKYNGLPDLLPWVFAITFVGFTIFIVELGIGFIVNARPAIENRTVEKGGAIFRLKTSDEELSQAKTTKWVRRFMGVVCIVVGLVMEAYSVASSAGAMYNLLVSSKYTTNEKATVQDLDTVSTKETLKKEEKTTNISNTKKLDATYATDKALYEKTIRLEFKDLMPTEITVLPVTQAFERVKISYEMKRSELVSELKAINKELEDIADAKDKSKNKGTTDAALNHGTVYTYLKTLTGIDEIYLQFWLTAWPSFFLGLISALSFAYCLYGIPLKRG